MDPPGSASTPSSPAGDSRAARSPSGRPPSPAVRQASDPSNVMVVHWQDEEARVATFNWLRVIGLRPMEWSSLVKATGTRSPYIGVSGCGHSRHTRMILDQDRLFLHVNTMPAASAPSASSTPATR